MSHVTNVQICLLYTTYFLFFLLYPLCLVSFSLSMLLLQKLYLQLTSKFLRNDRSGKANSSWIYTALLNLQLHTPAHTQAHALQQSPWPLRGCGDTWKYFDPWMIEKYLETLR